MNDSSSESYDLLIRGGTVVDPAAGLDAVRDVGVRDGVIARIDTRIDPASASRIIDAEDRLVVPGLIDGHAHVMDGVTPVGLRPDLIGVEAGVTTIVDAGSAGASTFAAFPRYIMPNAKTEILPFLHVGRTGLATIPEVESESDIDREASLAVIERHRQHIYGVKVRIVWPSFEALGMDLPRISRDIAREAGLPLMVHIGDTAGRLQSSAGRDALELLDRGDIVTHLFTHHAGGALDEDGTVWPQLRDAVDRGVMLDTAHGKGNFSFEVARRILDQGIRPDCISTDLAAAGLQEVVFSLTDVMTRFLRLGFSVSEVIAMTTIKPATAAGVEHRLGTLGIGRQADISILDLRHGDFELEDATGALLRAEQAFVPVLTVKRGEIFTPGWGPRPWGWEPRRIA
ncbi:MAG: amidohydrolase/deacetylase family metallohydrolase [Cryobacterium sp.]|nr:amidohydrolase/deacetylase family metallohydrolase [Cryobacterium sp.]